MIASMEDRSWAGRGHEVVNAAIRENEENQENLRRIPLGMVEVVVEVD